VQHRQSTIWTIQYHDANGLNQTESPETSDKKKARVSFVFAKGRRERIVVENLTVADGVKLVKTD
jgi:hypothetical protein